MQKDAGDFLAQLGECIEVIKRHLSRMDIAHLERLLESMPTRSAAGSPEMVMTVLLYREIESRNNYGDVLPWAAQLIASSGGEPSPKRWANAMEARGGSAR